MTTILPEIKISKSYEIHDLKDIQNTPGTGVYVIWDEKRSGGLPLYVGNSYYNDNSWQDLGKRVSDHIMGYTHLKKYCMYFYHFDFYVFDNSRIDPTLADFPTTYNVNARVLADLYEIDKTSQLIPYFNKKNHHHAEKRLDRQYFIRGFHKTNHRSVVLTTTEAQSLQIPHNYPIYQYCEKCGIIKTDIKNKKFDPNYTCNICK